MIQMELSQTIETGGRGTVLFMVVGVALMVLALLIVFIWTRRKNAQDDDEYEEEDEYEDDAYEDDAYEDEDGDEKKE